MDSIILKIRKDLKEKIEIDFKKNCTKFFKEKIKIYGVRTPTVRKISDKHFKVLKNTDKKKIFVLCEDLMKSNYNEEFTIAAAWLYKISDQFEERDYKTLKVYLEKYVSNWSMCDDYCTHALGYLIYKFPELIKETRKWASSKNRWMRRASAIVHIHPTKKASPWRKNIDKNPKFFLYNVFYISDFLLKDEDDLVQKGYGWALKEASNLFENDVFTFVIKRKMIMSRTALRYAIEKMPNDLRKKAMSKQLGHKYKN